LKKLWLRLLFLCLLSSDCRVRSFFYDQQGASWESFIFKGPTSVIYQVFILIGLRLYKKVWKFCTSVSGLAQWHSASSLLPLLIWTFFTVNVTSVALLNLSIPWYGHEIYFEEIHTVPTIDKISRSTVHWDCLMSSPFTLISI
jgi:hypothetical protein